MIKNQKRIVHGDEEAFLYDADVYRYFKSDKMAKKKQI